MGHPAVRVLLVEDSEEDYLLTRRMLSSIEGQTFDLEWAPSWETGIEAVRRADHDVCLLDYRIGSGDGLELLKEARGASGSVPVILLTGVSDYRLDVEAMQLGAADFLVKDHLTPALLERSIRYAIAQTRTLDELQRQRDELRSSELRFRSVVQSAADAIILADDQSRIVFWNQGAENMFGYREDEIIGRLIEVLMPEQYREKHRAAFKRFCLTGRSEMVGRTVELEALRRDGTVFPIELSLASWTSGNGTYCTGILRDITERKRADEMQRAKEAAEEANRAKSTFVARMSHELRTPLHAIAAFTSILLENRSGNLKPSDIDFLQRILLNAKDQLHLINTILDLSKVEAGRVELQSAPVNLNSMITEIVRQLEAERHKANVALEVRIPEGITAIETDGNKLKQVLINLVDNALKFTEEGRVTIEVVANPEGLEPVCINVSDTGIGIPPERVRDIFEPFFQLQTGSPDRASGTGLGLSICRSLCDLLGYSLRVRSTPTKGSTFTVIMSSEEPASVLERAG